MQRFNVTTALFFLVLLTCNTSFAIINEDKYHDYRDQYLSLDLLKMQQFHMQQAQLKLQKGQMAYAWGDLAYLLCHIPNHHNALQQMQELAFELNKHHEMVKFFEKAIAIFPNDTVVHRMHADFNALVQTAPN